jgi:hypothetical protein
MITQPICIGRLFSRRSVIFFQPPSRRTSDVFALESSNFVDESSQPHSSAKIQSREAAPGA